MKAAGKASRIVRVAACAVLAAGAAWAMHGCHKEPTAPQVTIHGQRWFVDLAVTPQQHFVGLAGRTELGADAGMLFIFPDVAIRQFCMRGCFIPLDIAFLDEQRRIVHIATMAVEEDRAGRVAYGSQRPAKYVLEVAAGALAGAGAKVGDEAIFTGPIPR